MMKKTILFLIFTMPLACCVSCATNKKDTTATVTGGSEIRVYEVFGMDCPGCQGGVEKLVKKIPAVQDAKADWQKKEIVITVRPESVLDDKDVLDAIRRANFTPGKRLK